MNILRKYTGFRVLTPNLRFGILSKTFAEATVKTKKIFRNKGIISKHIEKGINKAIDEEDIRGYIDEIVKYHS
jgi:hypothetical protein